MPKSTKVRAAIYARISRDREGAGLGVDRQEADCRALAERLGWEVVAVFVDNDISAYDRRKIRPEYRQMLDAVRTGQVNAIIAWHPDRLHRRMTELEDFITLVETYDTQIQTVRAGQYDLSTPSGQTTARILGAVAQGEVSHGRERVQRQKDEAAAAGEYRGGPRPFGFEPGGLVIREAEAEAIRWAMNAVLAGRSLRMVADELNERGIRPATMARKDVKRKPQDGRWDRGNLRDMLLRPRNAGILAHGLPNRQSTEKNRTRTYEEVGKAKWPAIVPEEQWRAYVALVTDPSRRQTDSNETKWLGAGIYVCGRCGATLRATPHGGTALRKYERRYLYRCTASAHLTIGQKQTDAEVRARVADLIRDPRIIDALHPADTQMAHARERRTVLTARLDAFEADYRQGLITGVQLQKATASVNADLAAIDAGMARSLRRSTSSAIMQAVDPGQAFLDAPVDVQRAVLQMVMTVTVLPAQSRGSVWTPERLRFEPIGA